MRRGPINKQRKEVFPLRILIPLVLLIFGVGIAYSVVTGDKTPPPKPEPIIIRPDSAPPITPDVPGTEAGGIAGNPDVIPAGPALPEPPKTVQFTDARVSAYKSAQPALKKTVEQYAKVRANQCSGEITVMTDDTPLNVRSGPSTGNPVLIKAPRGSKHNVLLWAPDSKNRSVRWFLLVDDRDKTVKGWAYGEYCDASGVVFAN